MTEAQIEALFFYATRPTASLQEFKARFAAASTADTAGAKPVDLLPNALWTRRGSGTDEWWSFKGYQARKDAADQWVLSKGGEELYRHTYLQVVMAHAERALLAAPPAPSVADAAGASEGQEPVAWMTEGKYPSPRFIIGNTDPSGVWKEKYVPLFLHPSAEIAALRERIAELEKGESNAV